VKKIGGEIPYQDDGLYRYLTDSGRSSLRLILHSLKGKKFALPDYLCGVILDVFREVGIEYDFYHVGMDLNVEQKKRLQVHGFYVIDYFGRNSSWNTEWDISDFIWIADCCFLPEIKKPQNVKNWIGFNSLRKISSATDGSIIKSTIRIPPYNCLYCWHAPFSDLKVKGELRAGEEALTKQIPTYSMSKHGIFAAFDFYRNLDNEKLERIDNYLTLVQNLDWIWLSITPSFPSFFPMLVDRRDELREYLKTKEIYLPVHWPKPDGVENPIYDRIISIPVDSRYDKEDMERVAREINGFYGK